MARPFEVTELFALHGFAGDVADWDAVGAARGPAARWHVVALYGHRGRPEPAASDFEAEVARLADLAESQGAAGGHLVGYSLGARLALGLLVRRPGLFARATLIGVHPGLAQAAPERAERRTADAAWAALLEREGLASFYAAWSAQPLFASQQRLSDRRAARLARLQSFHHPRGLTQALRALSLAEMADWRGALPEIAVPVALVHGAADVKFATLAAELAARLPRAEVHAIAGCGHNPLLEAPAALAALLALADPPPTP